MSIFLLPRTMINKIEKKLNSYRCGHNIEKKEVCIDSWERFTLHKDFGGIGFKNHKAFNLAMFGKQASKLISSPNSLITRLLKVRYFPTNDYFT